MHVRLAEPVKQIAKSKKAFDPLVLRQVSEASDDGRIDGKKFTQAAS